MITRTIAAAVLAAALALPLTAVAWSPEQEERQRRCVELSRYIDTVLIAPIGITCGIGSAPNYSVPNHSAPEYWPNIRHRTPTR